MLTMASSSEVLSPIVAAGFKRNAPLFAHDIQQWIVTTREPSKLFQLGRYISLHNKDSPDSPPQAAILSHIKTLEIEWVSFYGSAEDHIAFEVSIPVYWVQLPAYRRLEYAILSHTMPVILARAFPAQQYYEDERSRYVQQRKQQITLRATMGPGIISTPQSFSVPLRTQRQGKRQITHVRHDTMLCL